jgi:hypothetical protein
MMTGVVPPWRGQLAAAVARLAAHVTVARHPEWSSEIERFIKAP